MKKNYTCETAHNKMPAEYFVNSLDEDTQDKFIYKKELLEELGPKLRFPHTDYIGDGISELRFRGKEGRIRIFFCFFYKRQIILLHGFVKKTKKTPNKEFKISQQKKKEYLERHKEE